jgi:predicted enzyme related to lactoylglutathione lyase
MANGDISHIEIPADDPQRATRFYEGMFGWSFTDADEYPDYHMFRTPSGEQGVGGAIGRRGQTAPDATRNYVTVDSIDSALEKLSGLGGSVVLAKTEVGGMGWYAAVNDSEGNEIGLWENAPGVQQG